MILMIFKSTYEIINEPWKDYADTTVSKRPPLWHNEREISVDDVVVWEQIYHQPGNIGIYVAWSPFEEFYLISYDLFAKSSAGIKKFTGNSAFIEVQKIAEKFNILLPTNTVRI
jgi:hypothetical protein